MSTCAHERFMSMLMKPSRARARARPLYRIMPPALTRVKCYSHNDQSVPCKGYLKTSKLGSGGRYSLDSFPNKSFPILFVLLSLVDKENNTELILTASQRKQNFVFYSCHSFLSLNTANFMV